MLGVCKSVFYFDALKPLKTLMFQRVYIFISFKTSETPYFTGVSDDYVFTTLQNAFF